MAACRRCGSACAPPFIIAVNLQPKLARMRSAGTSAQRHRTAPSSAVHRAFRLGVDRLARSPQAARDQLKRRVRIPARSPQRPGPGLARADANSEHVSQFYQASCIAAGVLRSLLSFAVCAVFVDVAV